MIAALKQTVLSASSHVGISTLIGQTAWRRDRLLVMCYHGVSLRDEHEWNPRLYVSPALLGHRLDEIRRLGATVLPLSEAVARLRAHDLPERAVALTFDDGFFDFLDRAYPLLQAHGYPATVYLTTKRCEHNRPITRLLLSYVLWRTRRSTLDGRGLPGLGEDGLSLATADQRARICDRVDMASQQMRLTPGEKDDLLKDIVTRLGADYDELASARLLTLMNPAEVRAMAARGVDFQLHTHRHRTPEDPDQFLAEIRINGDLIRDMTGVNPTHFCYPSGVHRPAYLPLLRGEGVVSATTCERGLVEPRTEPLLMPRFVDTNATSDAEFAGWLTGAAAWLPHRRRSPVRVQTPGCGTASPEVMS